MFILKLNSKCVFKYPFHGGKKLPLAHFCLFSYCRYNFCFLIKYFVRKTLLQIALSTLLSQIRREKYGRIFRPLVLKIVLWPFCPKNPNFKFQFQPLWNKIGRGKNLGRLIDLNKVERANDKNVRHAWA